MSSLLDFRERSRLRRIVYSKPTIFAILVLALLATNGAWGMYQKNKEAIVRRDKAIRELQTLEARENQLKEDIARLSTARGQEEEIRDRFMVAKDGEKVIIVAESAGEATHTITVPEEQPPTFMEKLKAAVGVSGE